MTDKKINFIVDNASNLWGEIQNDLEIQNPITLKDQSDINYFIIICTTSFREVYEQLINYGFIPEENFIVSPILNDLRIINDLENVHRDIIFTSGAPYQESNNYGGGVYELNLKVIPGGIKRK